MTFLKNWLPSIMFGVLVASVLGYPLDCLLIENSKDYKIFTQSKLAYDEYVKKHEKKPKDLSFLPFSIRNQVNQDGYPLQYNTDDLRLTCMLRAPLGTTPSLKNYLWPPTPPVEMYVGKLLSR